MRILKYERIPENRDCTKLNCLCYQLGLQLLKITTKDKAARKRKLNTYIYKRLRRRYYCYIADRSISPVEQSLPPKKAYVFWGQGFDNAPLLVQKCLESMKRHLPDYEIIELNDANMYEYIEFPPHIKSKIEKGLIHYPQMTDLLRLELLTKNGGLWLDSTIFATGAPREYITDKPLFLYSVTTRFDPNDYSLVRSWLISAGANNRILIATRDLLYKYWERRNSLASYFLFHMFFTMAAEHYAEDWAQVPDIKNIPLNAPLLEPYDAEAFAKLCELNSFHKLNYRKYTEKPSGTLYDVLIRGDMP